MRVLVALCAVAAFGSCCAAAAAVPVFSRQVLTDVSWLEMEVRDARRVTVTLRGQPQTFAFGIGLTFVEKRRTETESRSVRGRSLTLAGNFTEGAPAWDTFRSRLLEFARRTEPAQLDQLLTRGQLFDPAIPGDYVIAACEGGGADRPEVGYELVREGPSGGSTTFGKAGPLCAELADAHRFTEPSAMLIARMTVAAVQEQVIEWTEVDRTARPPEPLPGGITVVRGGPPPGATAWSHAQPGTYATPDLTGYITEGQIVASRDLHRKGIFPPIAVERSLSRLMGQGIGAGHTRDDHRAVSDQLYAAYAEGRDLRGLVPSLERRPSRRGTGSSSTSPTPLRTGSSARVRTRTGRLPRLSTSVGSCCHHCPWIRSPRLTGS